MPGFILNDANIRRFRIRSRTLHRDCERYKEYEQKNMNDSYFPSHHENLPRLDGNYYVSK